MCHLCYHQPSHIHQIFTIHSCAIHVTMIPSMLAPTIPCSHMVHLCCHHAMTTTTCTHAPMGMMKLHQSKPCNCATIGITCYHPQPTTKRFIPKPFIHEHKMAEYNPNEPCAMCECCHHSFIMGYMKYGITKTPLFQSPKHYCTLCTPHDFMSQ